MSSLGINERVSPQVMRHGGASFPDFVIIAFHTSIRLRDAGGRWIDSGPEVAIWPPGVVREYGNPVRPWTHSWINCHGTVLHELIAEESLPLMTPLGIDGSAPMTEYAGLIHEELHARAHQDPVMLASLLRMLLHAFARTRKERVGGADDLPESIVRARQYIDAHLTEVMGLADIARAAALSVTQLSRLFRTHFEMSPIDFVINLRIERAKSFLLGQHMTIREVSTHVGFGDPHYFSRQFAARTGVSPARFRASRDANDPSPSIRTRRSDTMTE